MRQEIATYYNKALSNCKNPYEAFTPLNDNEMKAIQINQKTLKNPPRVYYEFMDPSCGTFFLTYSPNQEHDFHLKIPNPHMRKIADNEAEYQQKFKPRPWQK